MRPILWIFSLLLLAPVTALAQHTVLVKAQTLSLRDKPNSKADTLAKLVTFQPVELLKLDGDWAQVKTAQNQTGYVLSDYLSKRAFVYTGGEKVNGRLGPGTQYETFLEYNVPNFPLRVLDATADGWLMVLDYDGERCWVSSKGVKTSGDYVITREENSNVRKGVGIGQDVAFKAQKGVILKALEEKDGWLHVKYTDGDEGWLSAKIVFGWADVPAPGAKSTAAAEEGKSAASTEKASDTGKTGGKKKAATTEKSGAKADSSDSGTKTTSRRTRKTASKASNSDDEGSGSSSKSTKSGSGKAKSSGRTKAGTKAKKKSSPDSDSDN